MQIITDWFVLNMPSAIKCCGYKFRHLKIKLLRYPFTIRLSRIFEIIEGIVFNRC